MRECGHSYSEETIEMFFTYNESANTFKYNVDNFNKNMIGKHLSNLNKHVFSHHKK